MPLVLTVNDEEVISINGELLITVKVSLSGSTRITFEGPKEKYQVLRLTSVRRRLKESGDVI